ncbi:hypothetical protein ACVXZZ_00050 [Staphylococcus aureus]
MLVTIDAAQGKIFEGYANVLNVTKNVFPFINNGKAFFGSSGIL